jgi:steroid delta-isomerase-like uncharacterized protein
MVEAEGTPTFADRESSQSFRTPTPTGAVPAARSTADDVSIGDATGETTELGVVAAANERFARQLFDDWNARDFDAFEAALAEDATAVIVPFSTTLRGARTIRDHFAGWATAFSDAQVEVTNVVADAHGAVVEFMGRGTHTGPFVGPGGTIAPTGRYGETPFCYVYHIDRGKVRHIREYYDTATIMRNLGLVT